MIDKAAETAQSNLAALTGPPTASTAPSVPENAFGQEQTLPEIQGYQMLAEIGRGGMGRVWAAIQLGTHRRVAIKFLPPLASERARGRFEREVDLASKLKHPNIVSIYDSGIYRGDYFYVMECVEGVHLDEYVRQHKLGDIEITRLMATVCRAVEHAHQFGVIHRDLKPSNILVTPDGQPHVLDFGLAKAALDDARAIDISLSGEIAGTPAYMSPEQAAGRRDLVSTRSDVYSLGVILYVLLTGKLTHAPENPVDLPRMTATQDVIPPRVSRPGIDAGLENLLIMALQLQPEKRYSSAGELARDLQNYPDGSMIARPESSREILLKRMRQYYAPLGMGTALLAMFAVTIIARLFTGRHLNTYSLYDLAGFVLTFAIAVMFLASYYAMGRRAIDLLFGLLMLLISVGCVLIFLTDNLVPELESAAAYAHQASMHLNLIRLAYGMGLLATPIQLHFILLYCGYTRWSGPRIALLYLACLALGSVVFLPQFLCIRDRPLGNIASWTCMVPWQPIAGPLVSVYLLVWVVSQVLMQAILYMRKRRGGILPRGPLSQIDTIRLTLAIQAVGVTADIAMGVICLASFSPYVATSVVIGFLFTIALVRERMTSDPFVGRSA